MWLWHTVTRFGTRTSLWLWCADTYMDWTKTQGSDSSSQWNVFYIGTLSGLETRKVLALAQSHFCIYRFTAILSISVERLWYVNQSSESIPVPFWTYLSTGEFDRLIMTGMNATRIVCLHLFERSITTRMKATSTDCCFERSITTGMKATKIYFTLNVQSRLERKQLKLIVWTTLNVQSD